MKVENCPICNYEITKCQCYFGGSAQPSRYDRKRVVLDHLWLLTDAQLKHVVELENKWRISYADKKLNDILFELKKEAALRIMGE